MEGVNEMNVTYDIREEAAFDSMVTKLKGMSEQEKQDFMTLLRGYQAGIKVGKRLAGEQQGATA